MKASIVRRKFTNSPIYLTAKEKANPSSIVYDYFDGFFLSGIRNGLWGVIATAMCIPDEEFGYITKGEIWQFYRRVSLFLEAAFIIYHQDQKPNNEPCNSMSHMDNTPRWLNASQCQHPEFTIEDFYKEGSLEDIRALWEAITDNALCFEGKTPIAITRAEIRAFRNELRRLFEAVYTIFFLKKKAGRHWFDGP